MFVAYLYNTTDINDACKQFFKENTSEEVQNEVLKTNNCENILSYLLKGDILNGELIQYDNKVAVVIENDLSNININTIKNIMLS